MVRSNSVSVDGWVTSEIDAMVSAWRRGVDASAWDAIERRPDVGVESAIRLIYEETCLRREAGQEVATAEVVKRYSPWGEELRALLECDRMIRSTHQRLDFPEVGEALGPFLLLAELGRGASGRTFLASDPGLADRRVVVKVIADDQDEHLALARLRHTHIVPLFSEHTFSGRGLRGLCMPFLGGASLAQILDDLAGVPFEQRTGKLLVKLIDRNTVSLPSTTSGDGPFRRGLEQASYVQAMTWIASCLADAIQYAHARGLVHMDVKPSNVLITMDGQPMLLDFHLARAPMIAGEIVVDRLGGTPGRMAPEQEAALVAVGEGRPLPNGVDGRADLYSLGLLLQDAIGPATVSLGLSDILGKCLAPDPCQRYPDAATLAEDLRRELDDLPLRGVRNRSPRERWRKWRRRHPVALAWVLLGLFLLVAVGMASMAAIVAHRQMREHLWALLEDGRRNRSERRYEEALRTLDRGLETAARYPMFGRIKVALAAERRLAERGRLAGELHGLAERIRFRHGIDLPRFTEGQDLLRLCEAVWDRRDLILGWGGPPLDRESERVVRTDLQELAAIRADLIIHLAPPEGRDSARGEALKLLEHAEATCGSSYALEVRRERLRSPRQGSVDEASASPTSAWEYYERGRFELRDGRLREAEESLRLALESRPQDFWANFYHGLCGFR